MQTSSENKGSEILFGGLIVFAAVLFIIVLNHKPTGFTTVFDDNIIAVIREH